MLDITGNDIKDLNDSDLRTLIGLLCEAELSYNNLPTAGVTWGGHHNAPDGGIDVRVDVISPPPSDSFIPRAKTAFQVKKPDMPRASIITEMKPKGILRLVIKDLVDSNGAYIIVSSQGSTADSALTKRVRAMKDSVSDLPNASNLKVDFYDRDRVAGWVRYHPSLALWIREKLGKPLQGWKSYGNWANCPDGVEGEYFSDDDIRLHDSSTSSLGGMSGSDGIHSIRNSLHQSASSVRLTGLSGVGKTRLLQALFDERIGENPLNKSQVFYTDISDSPIPAPRNFAEQLMALRKPAILAVDNCPPDLHRSLTSLCTASGSLISLITVEYDVREDQPEETKGYRLEPASTGLIEKVITARFNYIHQVDAHTIAEFSGGNARIAIALANTVKHGENLSNLKDDDLFNRLFHQRYESNSELLRAAEVCSLVYSFNGDTGDETNVELKLLSSLAEIPIRKFYGHISELKRRELIQQRSVWRAVLPHAIANKLAQRALDDIPLSDIRSTFEQEGSERLLKSFSRRLSYLHENDNAKQIAKIWLSENGLLSNIGNLNSLGVDILENISPITPEAALLSIEKAAEMDSSGTFLTRDQSNYIQFTRLLRSLAYDEVLFDRSVNLLCQYALSERPEENNNSIRSLLKSLFYLYLSGTHASAQQRLNIISSLIKSENNEQIELAFELLDAALESWHFSSSEGFEFGAHSRDQGFWPKNNEEVKGWFKLFIEFTVEHAITESPSAKLAKSLLANKFRALWIKANMFDELESAAKRFILKGAWNEGWVAVKTTLSFDGENMSAQLVSRLNTLVKLLAPSTLIDRVRLFALTTNRSAFDLVDTFEEESASDSYYKAEEITRSIGSEVVRNETVLNEILSELLSTDAARSYSFGQGLADGCSDPVSLWQTFRDTLSSIETSHRQYRLLFGFLNSLSGKASDITNQLLDDAVADTILGEIFPHLQTNAPIDPKAIKRFELALERDIAPIWQYKHLAYGCVHKPISDEDLCRILRLISSKADGTDIAIEILAMRLRRSPNEPPIEISNIIASIGKELLLDHDFMHADSRSRHIEHNLDVIIKSCFFDGTAASTTTEICKKLAEAISAHNIYNRNYIPVFEALSIMQPRAFLDGFLGKETAHEHKMSGMFSIGERHSIDPLSEIDDDLIIEWCQINPTDRYPVVANTIKPYQISEQTGGVEWTSLSKKLVLNSSDPIIILNIYKAKLRPMMWSGSRADIMQEHLSLITELKEHNDSIVAGWAAQEEVEFRNEISVEKKWELEREKSNDERFE
jgi:hypothetical protein